MKNENAILARIKESSFFKKIEDKEVPNQFLDSS